MNNLSVDFNAIDKQIVKTVAVAEVKTEVEKPKISEAKFKKELEKLMKAIKDTQESIDSLYEQKTIPELYGASIYMGLSLKELKTLN
jgi:hypothetical protein